MAEQRERAEASEAFHALWSSARRDDDVLQTTAPGDALQLFADAAPAPSAALEAFTTTAVATPESRHEPPRALREERRALVAAVSRRTGEAHRAIHARINRETGARSVTAASVEQLERGNRLLERQAKRR